MLPLYIIDSFTSEPFKGNPAGVVVADKPMDVARMQSIATELNFSETAFLSPLDTGNAEGTEWRIRYFSPLMEIPLCGHATLASAKALFDRFGTQQIKFLTHSNVELIATEAAGRIEMAFPVYSLTDDVAPPEMLKALGIKESVYVGFNRENNMLMLEIESSEELASLEPDFVALVNSHSAISAVAVTAAGHDEFDFHSRLFWPWAGGDEDPVTGATHTFLAKYWSEKLGKTVMQSFQASSRTGQMEVELTNNSSLLIRGDAVLILEGELKV